MARRLRMTARLQSLARSATFVVAAVIAYLSLAPSDPESSGGMPILRWIADLVLGNPEEQDKVGHFLAYVALAGLAGTGFRQFSLVAVFMFCLAFGGTFEVLQASIPGRYASLADMAANASGATLGLAGAYVLQRLLKGLE